MERTIVEEKQVSDDGEMQRSVTNIKEGEENTLADVPSKLIYLLLGIVLALISLRFVFLLLGANSNNGFVDLIYAVSSPLVAPFHGMFNTATTNLNGVNTFEIESLVSIVVYALIGWVLSLIINTFNPKVPA